MVSKSYAFMMVYVLYVCIHVYVGLCMWKDCLALIPNQCYSWQKTEVGLGGQQIASIIIHGAIKGTFTCHVIYLCKFTHCCTLNCPFLKLQTEISEYLIFLWNYNSPSWKIHLLVWVMISFVYRYLNSGSWGSHI